MRRRLPVALAVPATALVFSTMTTVPASAATIPTTPVPSPVSPGQPPASKPFTPQPLGHAIGDAAAAVGDIQLFPGGFDTPTILPGFGEQLPKQALFEGGLGLTSAQANSESYLNYERSIAESSPIGGSIAGNAPSLPGALRQTALPDNPEPTTGGFALPKNPLLNLGLLQGTAHARWSDSLGPCVGTISDTSTSVAGLSVLDLGSLDGLGGLTNLLDQLKKLLSPQAATNLVDNLKGAAAKDQKAVSPEAAAAADKGGFALISAPDTISSRSTVKLVDMPGTKNKAVQSTSRFQLADITLFKGLGPLSIQLKVASQPTLTVTSTGKEGTSKVDYKAPAFEILQDGKSLGSLDATHPFEPKIGFALPGILDNPETAGPLKDLLQSLKLPTDPKELSKLPLLGETLTKITEAAGGQGLTIPGLLKLSIGDLVKKGQQETKGKNGAPFSGYQLGATGNMLNLDLLPLPGGAPKALTSLAFGKQVARAYAPTDGVECGTTKPPATKPGAVTPPKGQAKPKPPLAYTDAAYKTVPLFWTGTGLLLAGVVLVAALPNRRVRKAPIRK